LSACTGKNDDGLDGGALVERLDRLMWGRIFRAVEWWMLVRVIIAVLVIALVLRLLGV
jgi:hypothetical protein